MAISYKIFCLFVIFTSSFEAFANPFFKALEEGIVEDHLVIIKKSELELKEILNKNSKYIFSPTLEIGSIESRAVTKGLNGKDINSKGRIGFLSSRLNLFSGFSDYALFEKSQYEYQLAKSDLMAFILLKESSISQQIFSYIKKTRSGLIQSEILSLKKQSLEITQLKYKKGMIAKQEVTKSLVDLENSQAVFDSTNLDLEASRLSLLKLLGHDYLEKSWPLAYKIKILNKEKVFNYKLSPTNRPDYKSLHYKELISKATFKKSRSSFFPKVDLLFNINKDLLDSSYDLERSAKITLSFNLLNGGRDYRDYKVAMAEKYAQHVYYQNLGEEISVSFFSLKKKLWLSVKSAKSRLETVELSRTLYKDNLKRFRRGKVSVNDMQVDQNRLLRSENLYNQGLLDFHNQYVKFCNFLGKRLSSCMESL